MAFAFIKKATDALGTGMDIWRGLFLTFMGAAAAERLITGRSESYIEKLLTQLKLALSAQLNTSPDNIDFTLKLISALTILKQGLHTVQDHGHDVGTTLYKLCIALKPLRHTPILLVLATAALHDDETEAENTPA